MNKMLLSLALSVCLPSHNEAFVLFSPSLRPTAKPLFSSPPSEGASEEEDGLILDMDKVQQQMGTLKSKYPTSEADYLAAARKRAELKVESQNHVSTDDDWKRAAQENKSQTGGAVEDGWEASLKEAGNEESQILIPIELDIGEEGEGDSGEEPKLLL